MTQISKQISMDAVVEIVKQAAELLKDGEAASHIKIKGLADYATEVDYMVQRSIRSRLEQEWPWVQFMGEETEETETEPELDLNRPVWILDPVDGTTNLIHDYRHSAVSLGLMDEGTVIMGIIYQPYTDELFTAEKGKGACLNGQPIRVSAAGTLAESLISIGTTPYHHEYAERNFDDFKKIFLACQDIRRIGSAAIEIAYVACGRTEAFFERNLKPWDFAAGLVILEEAGGTLAGFDTRPVFAGRPQDVAAHNGRIGDELMAIIGV